MNLNTKILKAINKGLTEGIKNVLESDYADRELDFNTGLRNYLLDKKQENSHIPNRV